MHGTMLGRKPRSLRPGARCRAGPKPRGGTSARPPKGCTDRGRCSYANGRAHACARICIHGATSRRARVAHAKAGGWRVGAWFAVLLAWRVACALWRGLCACMLGRDSACLPAIPSAFACSCAWLMCSVICAKHALMCKAGSRVAWLAVCLARVCWVKLRT